MHAELMLLGFISLMLNVFQGATQKICVKESVMHHLLPCPRRPPRAAKEEAAHYGAAAFTGVLGSARRLLAGGGASSDYCLKKVRTICPALPEGITGSPARAWQPAFT